MSVLNAQPTAAPAAPVSTEAATQSVQEVAPPAAAPAEKAIEEKKKYKLKYESEEEEVDEDKLLSYAQKGKGADKKFQEAAKVRKQADEELAKIKEFMDKAKGDTLSVLSELGVDEVALADMILEKHMKELAKTPEQQRAEKAEAELTKLQKQIEEENTRKEQERIERETQDWNVRFQNEMFTAIDKSALPVSGYTVKRVADIMSTALELGKNCTAEQAVKMLENSMQTEYKDMSDDQLFKLLGNDVTKRITKATSKKLQEARSKLPPKIEETGVKAPVAPKEKVKYTPDELFGNGIFGKKRK